MVLDAEREQRRMMIDAGMTMVSPSDFLSALYPDDEVIPITHSGVDGGRGTYRRCKRSEVLSYVKDRSDAYVFPVRFFNQVPRSELMEDLLAFVIDLDDMASGGLRELIRDIDLDPRLKPTHITRTGGGCHLWYLLDEPVQCRKSWKRGLTEISSALYDYWDDHAAGCIADKHCRSIPHGFRVPGSRTKDSGGETTAWQVKEGRSRAELREIMEALEVAPTYPRYGEGEERLIDFYRLEDLEEEHRRAEQWKKEKADRKTAEAPKSKKMPYRHPNLYYYSLERTRLRTRKGNRYLSMWSLASIGFTCRIPKKEVRKDLESLVELWSSSNDPVKPVEIENALLGYDAKWIRLKRETREELFGWDYEGEKKKRNYGEEHRTRSEHMTEVNIDRGISKEARVRRVLRTAEPGITIAEVSRRAGVSYPTAHKYVHLYRDIEERKK